MADDNYMDIEEIVANLEKDVLLGVRTDGQKEALMKIAVYYASNVVSEMNFSLDSVVAGKNLTAPVARLNDDGNWEVLKKANREFEKNVLDAYKGLFSDINQESIHVFEQESSKGNKLSRQGIPFESSETQGAMRKSLCDRCYEAVLPDNLLDDECERDKVKEIALQLFHGGVPDLDFSAVEDVVRITAENETEKEEKINSFIDKVLSKYGTPTKGEFKIDESALPIPDKYQGKEFIYASNPQSLADFVNDVFVSPEGDIHIGDIVNFVTDNSLRKVRGSDRYVNADDFYAAVLSTDKWIDRRNATDEVNAHTKEFEEQNSEAYNLFKKYIDSPTERQFIMGFMGMLKGAYKRLHEPTEKDGTPKKGTDFMMRRYVANETYHNSVDTLTDPIAVYQHFMTRQEDEIKILMDEKLTYSTVEQRNHQLTQKYDVLSQENQELTELVAKYETEKRYNHNQLQEAKQHAATAENANRTLVRELRRIEKDAKRRKVMGGKYVRTHFKIAAAAAILLTTGAIGLNQYSKHQTAQGEYNAAIDNFNNEAELVNKRMERALKIMSGEIPIPSTNPAPTQNQPAPRILPPAKPAGSGVASNPLYNGRNHGMAYRSPRK